MTWGQSAAHMSDEGLTAGAARGNTPEERRRAVRRVAELSTGAEDCAQLLSALGLSPEEVRP